MIAAFDRGDWHTVVELIAPNARAYVGGMEADRDGWRAMGEMFSGAFPDAKHDILATHLDGEYATVVCRFRGTHKGAFMGLPATGRQVAFDVIHVDRVVGGRIVEHRGQFDSAGLMQQLSAPASDPTAVAKELFNRIDGKAFDRARELLTPDVEFNFAGQRMTADGWQGFSHMFFGAFPDGRHVHEELLVAGDRVTCIGTFTGTHRGEFQGIAPTGRALKLGYIAVMRLRDGKCSELRVQVDSAGLMQQLTAA